MRWAGRVPVSIVRPGIVFGPGNREMLPMFRSIAVARVHAVPGFAPRRVSLIHVDDLIRLIERVATDGDHLTAQLDDGRPSVMGTEQGVFFAGDRQTPSLHELGRLIGRSLDLPSVLILHVAEPVALLSGALNQWLSKYRRAAESFNIDKIREAFAGDWTCCVERAERLLGFRPARTLSERIRETAQWYRDAGWLTGPANEP